MASFEFFEDDHSDSNGQARFTVFGVGGAGGNAVQHMLQSEYPGRKVCLCQYGQAGIGSHGSRI